MIALLARVPLKAWLGIAAIAALAFVLWHDHHMSRLYKAEKAAKVAVILERDQLHATIQTMKADAALNKETIHALDKRNADIKPVDTTVSVRCHPASILSAESRASSGTDAASERGGTEAPLRDIGLALEAVRVEAQRNNARFVTLQEWELARSH